MKYKNIKHFIFKQTIFNAFLSLNCTDWQCFAAVFGAAGAKTFKKYDLPFVEGAVAIRKLNLQLNIAPGAHK
mgnify:CR=1 FL=1